MIGKRDGLWGNSEKQCCCSLANRCCKSTTRVDIDKSLLAVNGQSSFFDSWQYRLSVSAHALPLHVRHQRRHVHLWEMSVVSLKMICNDFLVVKANCWSYVFNIMKYIEYWWTSKNKNIVEKKVWKCTPMICLLFASDDVIPGKHNQTAYWVLMLTTDRATTHKHEDKHRNTFLKHKWVKQLLIES